MGQLAEKAKSSWRVLFQDEARFGRVARPRRCWAPYPSRPSVPSSIVREFTYAYCAVCPTDGTLVSLIQPDVDSDSMSRFLEEVSRCYPDDFILMVLDGAAWHKSKTLSVPENIRLLPLPPYSPELNPAEHLWEEIREKHFTNRILDSIDAVEDLLFDALKSLHSSPELLTSLCGFNWIIND